MTVTTKSCSSEGTRTINTDVLIIGAGPFGLAISAYARHLEIDHLIVGKPMEFWKAHMPEGMVLRSSFDWHLDPLNEDTIERFLETQGVAPADAEPLSLPFYLSYAKWFQEKKGIEPIPVYVQSLDRVDGAHPCFRAVMEDGRVIVAEKVVISLGFKHFTNLPPELIGLLPAGRYSHTCDIVNFTDLKEKNCLIVGGRQSAFESAALAHEAGARAVHVSCRHDTPAFTTSDWSWVEPLTEAMVHDPGWFRNLSPAEKEEVNARFWAEGRLKLEPWLESRIRKESIHLWPNSQLVTCNELPSGELSVRLDNGNSFNVDHVILATGYKVDVEKVPLLSRGNILDQLASRNGFPELDTEFQTNISNLFMTSMMATQDFGSFYAFTVSVRSSAKIIGQALQR